MNDFGADLFRRLSQVPRAIDIDSLSYDRILLGLIDLDHRAIGNQRRPRFRYEAMNRWAIGDIEIAMLERKHFMLACQAPHEMATHQACRTSD